MHEIYPNALATLVAVTFQLLNQNNGVI